MSISSAMGSVLGNLGQLGSNAVSTNIGSSHRHSHSHSSAQDAFNSAQMRRMDMYAGTDQQCMHSFSFEEIENGWLIMFKGKKWMVNDLEELSQRVVAIMVEHKLEK